MQRSRKVKTSPSKTHTTSKKVRSSTKSSSLTVLGATPTANISSRSTAFTGLSSRRHVNVNRKIMANNIKSSSNHDGMITNRRQFSTESSSFPVQLNDPELFQTKNWINGQFVPAKSGKTINVHDPGNDKVIGEIAFGDASDIREAVDISYDAQKQWSKLPAHERCSIVKRWGTLMMENQDDLAKILSIEQGKPFNEAKGEIAYSASFLSFYGEYSNQLLGGESLQMETEKVPTHIVVERAAVGVVGAITPWNFPSAMITRKAGPALAAGCAMILKPSEYTPYSANALAVLGQRAGIPDGVFHIITGDPQAIGEELSTNEKVRKITFTGSTEVGKILLRQAASTVKRVSMELGGNAPFIVFDDADLDLAINQAITSKTRNAGQTCVTPNRFIVHQSVLQQFTEAVTERMKNIKVGYGMDEGTEMGPLINDNAVKKVQEYVQDALDKGAILHTGGKILTNIAGGSKRYFEPTVISNVTSDMKCFQDEIFGPVLSIIPFTEESEAITIANDTRAGLASYIFTKDIDRQSRLTRALEYGMVGCNQGSVSSAIAPFGGMKESGIGREGSKFGIDEYIEVKAIHYHSKF